MLHIKGAGDYDLAIVGESNYQPALVRIAGKHKTEGRRVECAAVLHLETDNPHDRNAVRVTIKGATVGYVSRTDAPDLREALGRVGVLDGQQVEVDAIIVGGRPGESYGVWLDLTLENEEDDEEDLTRNPAPIVASKKK